MKISEIYKDKDLNIQYKAPLLYKIQIISLISLVCALGLIQFLPVSFAFVIPFLLVISAVSVFILRKGKYVISMYLFISGIALFTTLGPFLGIFDSHTIIALTGLMLIVSNVLVLIFVINPKISLFYYALSFAVFGLRVVLSILNRDIIITDSEIVNTAVFPAIFFIIVLVLLRVFIKLVNIIFMQSRTQVKKLKENEKTGTIPVIMLTGVSDRKSIQEALSSGIDYYIVKPFEVQELLAKINEVLESIV